MFNFNIYYYFLGKRGGKNKVPQMERRKGEKGKRTKRKGGSWIWWAGQKKFAKEKRRNGCQRIGGKKRTRQVKFGYSEKATKFEKIFHLKFDVTE